MSHNQERNKASNVVELHNDWQQVGGVLGNLLNRLEVRPATPGTSSITPPAPALLATDQPQSRKPEPIQYEVYQLHEQLPLFDEAA